MRHGKKTQGGQVAVLLLVIFTLLLALLLPHALHPGGDALAFVFLFPVFLFGAVLQQGILWSSHPDPENASITPRLPSRFQLPPPSRSV